MKKKPKAKSRGPSVTSSDAQPPPRDRLKLNRFIQVGSIEELANGKTLRCFVEGDEVVAAVFEGERRTGRFLSFSPGRERLATRRWDEGEFSRVVSAYRINSPWHDGEYTCLVVDLDCLRSGRKDTLLTFKDL